MEYSAGMVSCLFWFSETKRTAELLIAGKEISDLRKLVIKENIYQVKTERRARQIFGAILRRFKSLPGDIVEKIARGDSGTVKLLLLIGIIKTDLLYFEFVNEVYRQAIILGENEITDRAINTFFEQKISQSRLVSIWSGSTIKRLKQCYTRMLFEAGVLSSATNKRQIIIPPVDYKLRMLLQDNNLQPYLNAITGEA